MKSQVLSLFLSWFFIEQEGCQRLDISVCNKIKDLGNSLRLRQVLYSTSLRDYTLFESYLECNVCQNASDNE